MSRSCKWNNSSRRWFISLLLFSLVLIGQGFFCRAAVQDTAPRQSIRVVTDNNYPPYVCHDSDGKLQGILVDQWRLWQKKTGVAVDISAMDWDTALKRMKAGEFDVIDTTFKTEERLGWLDFGKPYADIEVSAFFNNEISGITDEKSLKGFVVAVKEGDAAVDRLQQHGIDNLVLFKSYEAIIQAAREHKVNVFVIDKPPALYFLYKYGMEKQFNESSPFPAGQFHRAVLKGNSDLLHQVESGFDLISSGELQDIAKKWYGAPLISQPSLHALLAGVGVLGLLLVFFFVWNQSLRAAVRKRTAELEANKEELRVSESRYRGIIENADDIFYRLDSQGSLVLVSPSGARLLGYDSVEEMLGMPHQRFWLHEEKRLAVLEMLQRDEVVRDYEVSLLRKDGTTIDASMTASFYHDKEGSVLGTEGIIRDITERKRAEEELTNTKDLLAQTSRMARVGGWEVSQLTGAIQWSEMTREIMEVEPGFQPTRANHLHFFPKGFSRDVVDRVVARAIQHGEAFDVELQISTAKGMSLWVRAIGMAEMKDGVCVRLYGTLQDIDDRKKTEAALIDSEERLRFLVKNSPYSLVILNADGSQRYVSPAAEKITGFPVEQLQGRSLDTIIHPDDMQAITAAWNEGVAHPEKEVTVQYRHIHKTRQWVYCEAIAQSFLGDPAIRGVIASVRDITSQKRAEEENKKLQMQLLQAQKMESVGRLAGGVAHDYNNMLSVILGHSEIALGIVGPGQPLFSNLQEISRAAKRSADLTRQLLAFARRQTVAPEVLDLNDTVAGMLKMLRRLIGEDIDLVWLPGEQVRPIKMDPSQIDQMLANLCVNARDAIADTGRVTIETSSASFDTAYCATHLDYLPGEFALLSVSDTGSGMDRETIGHLFEPFFTTKEIGKGTGLGLATVYGIVQQNNGFLVVDSQPGQGTTFKMYLPVYAAPEEPKLRNEEEITAVRGQETILLVEDEPMILDVTATMLRMQGYTVLAASSPGQAVRITEEHAGKISMLMTDVIMPEMNGRDLAKNLQALRPNLKCLFMSGYTADVIAPHGVLEEGVHFIQKPFAMQALIDKIKEVLG
ncbi:MAG: PAS domain S-box protein [Desulforhopalus sp.]|nr:PAS domain S-box protein [Desulforhopalus sp.]